jgi:hypothetical protein
VLAAVTAARTSPSFTESFEVLAELTTGSTTSAAMLAVKPAQCLTTSFDSGARWWSGTIRPDSLPISAPEGNDADDE